MKTPLLLLILLPYCVLAQVPAKVTTNSIKRAKELNPYTFSEKITQSTLHDAIQLYYARHSLTFYFKPIAEGGYHVIDLYNNKNLGSITNFANDLNIQPDEQSGSFNSDSLIKKFVSKYNGKFTYVMTKLVTAPDQTQVMCKANIRNIIRRNANMASAPDSVIDALYDSNSFLSPLTAQLALVDTKDILAFVPGITKRGISDEGGGSKLATNLAHGAAKFLIGRANEEINAAFFRRLKKVMDDTEELQKLFPETYALTGSLESYNFDAALNVLRTKLNYDLENLLGNISQLAAISRYEHYIDSIPELTYLLTICDLMHGLGSNQSPGEIIQKVYSSAYIRRPISNVSRDTLGRPISNQANVLKLAGFISFSLRDIMLSDNADQTKGWISPHELDYKAEALVEIFRYYLGLLQLADPGIVFETKGHIYSLQETIRKIPDIGRVSALISEIYESVKIIERELAFIKAAKEEELLNQLIDLNKFEHYKIIAIEILNIAERTIEFPALIPEENQQEIVRTIVVIKESYIPKAEALVKVAANIEKEEYSEAVYTAGLLLEEVLNDLDSTSNRAMFSSLFKYGQFFASVATAEDGDDVKVAIDAIALPTGSSSLKKDLKFNLAVNGYIGYFNRHVNEGDIFVEGFTQSYGITAPIGFTLSTGFRKGGSLSLFAGILDVGAIAQYELEQDQTTGATEAEPVIDWGNIFSPSAHVVYGFPLYIPLSAGIGYQWLANTAEISDDKYTLKPRFNFFLCFDIPIVNIVSQKRPDYPHAGKTAGKKKK